MTEIEKERFCRSIPYPQLWEEGVLALEALFRLSRIGQDDWAISVASRYLLKSLDGAHSYGRYVVSKKNEVTSKERQTYIGFYDIFCTAVDEVQADHYAIDVRWRPEDGRKEHFQIEIISSGTGTRRERSSDRTRIIAGLAARVVGPFFDPVVAPELEDIAAAMPRRLGAGSA